MSSPEFVDNRNGNSLGEALRKRLLHLAETLKAPVSVAIATGYFNPEGYAKVADALATAGGVRLLLGAEPTPPPVRPTRHLTDPRGAGFEAKLTREALAQNEQGLLRDRDHLAFDKATDSAVAKLLEFLASGKIEVRRYEKQFLHGKAYLFSGGNGVIAGSSNFTAAGLQWNLELNLGQYQPHVTGQVERWFEDLWTEAVEYDLAAIYQARFAEYDPYLIYLRVLWERYKDDLTAEQDAGGKINLTRFQSDGLERAKRILGKYNGVLVADSVGLGKTFLAGALLDEVINKRRQRALLIAPAALRDGTWARFKSRFQLGVEVKSFQQVAQGALNEKPELYSLIIVDEAHAYRHADNVTSQALRTLLRAEPPRQVVLMTATPVNNSLWDLYELLNYFVGHDAVFADLGIPSLRRRFDKASKEDPLTLKPDMLFDVLDATTVRRTRHFVQRYYPDDKVKRPDGSEETIKFPKPHVSSLNYDIDKGLPGFFKEFAEILQPEDGEPKLTMARYWPSKYRKGKGPEAREVALVGLIRAGLLKRFESSAYAFRNTLQKMIRAHEDFLKGLERGVILASDALAEIAATDNDEVWDEVMLEGDPVTASDHDLKRLKKDVAGDLEQLKKLLARVAGVTRESDPKLKLLIEAIRAAAKHAEKTGLGGDDTRNRRKILIFSYFADTVEWIYEYLREELATDRSLADYKGRLAAVRGTEGVEDVGRREAVYGFAPVSSEAPANLMEDKFDILVTTDVLAEGMNLQQAARIVNYDLPWNPMRLVQRHGRIDRIGSPHKDVYITCIFPDKALEKLLRLEERVRRKLAQANASVGLDSEVIPGVEAVELNFTETREELEKLRKGDAGLFERGGEDVSAHSGEEYRQELRKGLIRYGERIKALPGAAGSGLRMGKEAGHFFCAKVDDKVFLRFVPTTEGQIIRDSLACLKRVTCPEGTDRHLTDAMHQAAYGAWERARKDIFDEWQKATDPANLTPAIRPLFKAAAAHVRENIPPEMDRATADRLVETLEAPWDMRREKLLRTAFTVETAEGVESTRKIAKVVNTLGMQPWKAPEPLPPIDLEEVTLVVWMTVEPA